MRVSQCNSVKFEYLWNQSSISHADRSVFTSLGKFTLSRARKSRAQTNTWDKAVCSEKEGFPGGSVVENPPAVWETQETRVQSLGQKDPLEKEMATHSSILGWEIHGQRSLAGCSPRGCKESDTTHYACRLLAANHWIPCFSVLDACPMLWENK